MSSGRDASIVALYAYTSGFKLAKIYLLTLITPHNLAMDQATAPATDTTTTPPVNHDERALDLLMRMPNQKRDRFALSCPSPYVLDRCSVAMPQVMDRYNHVMGSTPGPRSM